MSPSDESNAIRQTLRVALQPEFRAALQAPPSEWFAAAERLATTDHLSACAVATLFDEDLLAAVGVSLNDPWFAFAWRRLSDAIAGDRRLVIPDAPTVFPKSASPESAVSLVVAAANEPDTTSPHPVPTHQEPEAVPAPPEPPDEITAPPERMLRLLPEVAQSVTAGATSVQALTTAVFTHLTGRAA